MKKLSFILVLCMLFGLISGCGSAPAAPKEELYVLDCGATLTAVPGMKEKEMDGFTAVLQGSQVMIMLLDENKVVLGAEDKTLKDYAQLIKNGNGFEGDFAMDANGNLAIEYERESSGTMFYYYATVHESGSSFWLCQMACKASMKEQYKDQFSKWSASLKLKDTEFKLPAIKEQTYTLDCGVKFTGPEGMREASIEGYDACLTDNYIFVTFMAEDKPNGWTLKNYADAVQQANGLDAFAKNEKGALCTAYELDNPDGMDYWYYVTVFETAESFWLCQISGTDSLKDRYEPYLAAWSASMKSAS